VLGEHARGAGPGLTAIVGESPESGVGSCCDVAGNTSSGHSPTSMTPAACGGRICADMPTSSNVPRSRRTRSVRPVLSPLESITICGRREMFRLVQLSAPVAMKRAPPSANKPERRHEGAIAHRAR
jgi:hypothetical protein